MERIRTLSRPHGRPRVRSGNLATNRRDHLDRRWLVRWCLYSSSGWVNLNTSSVRSRRNGQHFANVVFKRMFFNAFFFLISIRISQSFVPKGPINNIPALVRIMAWRRLDDKPLSEPMVVSLQTLIWVNRPQWVYTRWCNMSVTRKSQITGYSTFFSAASSSWHQKKT